jgi:hypothetical protein
MPPTRPALPARFFYGIILAGFLLGTLSFSLGGWAYLLAGDRKPTGHRIWDGDIASVFVIPISAMLGATFGGLTGVSFAIALSFYRKRSDPTPLRNAHLPE